jgi:ERG2 and Sigma1 receptor like protein
MAYIFDPQALRKVCADRLGLPPREAISAITQELARMYPGHIETREDWFFNIAGGATGIMTVLHGSLSEYLIWFGTPVGTEGFSGRYHLDIYDVALSGQFWVYDEDDPLQRKVYLPGELAHLRRRRVKGFRISEDCWVLEYGRGPVPTCLAMGLSGAVLSLDGGIIWKTIRNYGRLVIKELLHGKI